MSTAFIIGLTVGLAVDIFAALEFNSIAQEKCFQDIKIFWWCFLFLPIGAMMVIALPDRENSSITNNSQTQS